VARKDEGAKGEKGGGKKWRVRRREEEVGYGNL
jgi:hypothetical protein